MSILLLLAGPAPGVPPGHPDVYLEVAFTTDPFDEPIWERIPKDHIRSISFSRGRSRELDRYRAGSLSVVLDNRTNVYTPDAVESHYPYVLPMRRIRLREVWDQAWPRFSGYIDSWDIDYGNPNDATVTVTATDGFKPLKAADLASSAYAQEVLNDGPVRWWRLGEPAGSTVFFDAVGSDDLAITGAPTLSTTGLISRDAGASMTITADSQGAQRTGPSTTGGVAPLTVEFLFNYDSDGAIYAAELNDISTAGWALIRAGSSIRLNLITDGTSATSIDAAGIQDGNTHHYCFTWDTDGTVTSYLDGVATDSGSAIGSTPATTILGIGAILLDSSFYGGQRGSYQEFAIYDRALSPARIAAHAEAVATPWNNDTPGERLHRVLDSVDWPDDLRDIDDGESTLQSADIANETALAHAQKVEASEFGRFFIDAAGNARLDGRHEQWQPPFDEPVATFSDDGNDTPYAPIVFDYSDQLIRNDVTVSRIEGVAQNAKDTTSIRKFTRHSHTADGLIHDDDDLSRDAANYLLSVHKDPKLRVTKITVRPRRDPDPMFGEVLKLELGDRILVERTPPGGSQFSQECVIEGIAERIVVGKDWTFDFQVSPADIPTPLILDSTSNGILDTNVLGF